VLCEKLSCTGVVPTGLPRNGAYKQRPYGLRIILNNDNDDDDDNNNNNNNNNGHCTHTSESADVKYIRASDMGTINSRDRIAATFYSLGTWFFSGI
jgi:hypothetical protein